MSETNERVPAPAQDSNSSRIYSRFPHTTDDKIMTQTTHAHFRLTRKMPVWFVRISRPACLRVAALALAIIAAPAANARACRTAYRRASGRHWGHTGEHPAGVQHRS